jgi:hypothetical protein
MNRFPHAVLCLSIAALAFTAPAFAAGKGGKTMGNKGYGNNNNNNNQNQNQNQTQNNNPPQQQQPVDTGPVKQAQSDLAAARDDQKKAEQALAVVVRRLQTDFESSGLMKTALDDLKAAQTQYQAASKVVLDKLATNADYKKAMDAKNAADAKVVKLQTEGAAPDDVTAASKDSLEKSSAVTKLQTEAITADAPANEAKSKLTAAGQHAAELRKQFTESLKDNTEWAAAKKAVDDAKDKVKTSESALADAQRNLAQQQAARR